MEKLREFFLKVFLGILWVFGRLDKVVSESSDYPAQDLPTSFFLRETLGKTRRRPIGDGQGHVKSLRGNVDLFADDYPRLNGLWGRSVARDWFLADRHRSDFRNDWGCDAVNASRCLSEGVRRFTSRAFKAKQIE